MSKKAGAPKVAGEKIYEIGYHIISSVAEENIPAEVAKVKEYLAKENAVIISEEAPALRPLAYPIKKATGGAYKTYDKAYFGFIKFELPRRRRCHQNRRENESEWEHSPIYRRENCQRKYYVFSKDHCIFGQRSEDQTPGKSGKS